MTTMADPLDALRLGDLPLAPRPEFGRALRARLIDAVGPRTDPSARPTGQEATMTDTDTSPTTDTGTALVPYLAVHDGAAAIDWYRDVLGATETMRYVDDEGRVGHAELVIGTAHVFLADEFPDIGVVGPRTLGNTPVTLHLEVVDVDHTFARAVAAGAEALRPPADQSHGNRNATLVDPFGHRWMLSQPLTAESGDLAGPDDEATAREGWTVTGRPPAELGYVTIHTDDLDRARRFFGELFAWQIEDGSVEGGGHIANTRLPMGLAPSTDGRATTLFIRVDDIETYATRVEELGGRVLARNDYPSGGNAECVDDQGYRFDLFRPAPGY